MTAVKEIAEQCRLRCSTILSVTFLTTSLFIPFKYSLRIFFILLNEFLILNTNMIFYSFILSNRSCGGGGGQFDTPPLSVFLLNFKNIGLRTARLQNSATGFLMPDQRHFLSLGITYTHSFGTDTHTWCFCPLMYIDFAMDVHWKENRVYK